MKKALAKLLAVGMMLSLTACGDEPAPVSNDTPASVSASVKEDPVKDDPAPASVNVDPVSDFKEAQRIWFLFEAGVKTDSKDVKTGDLNGYDMDYYRVTEPGFGSLQEMQDTLSTVVDPGFAAEAVNERQGYREFDGALYVCPAGRGDDMTMSWVEISSESDGNSGKVIVTVHRQDFFDSLGEWYETGAVDTYEYPFNVKDGHAIFTKMDYLCGSAPETQSRAGYDPDSLEAALVGLLEGTWTSVDGTTYYQIGADGSFTYYIGEEAAYSGVIFSSRSTDGSYMMESADTRNTLFTFTTDQQGLPVLEFDDGQTVFVKEGMG